MTDLIAISGVVGGLFGGGGGGEMRSALVRVAARAKYGTTVGDQVWQAFRAQNDPETVLTLHNGQSFPYGQAPAGAAGVVAAGPRARPARCRSSTDTDRLGAAAVDAPAQPTRRAGRPDASARQAAGMSNAVVVSGAHDDDRQPDRRVRPADRLLLPAAADAAGAAGPGHQRARRRVRRAQPVRPARPRARTTRGAPPRPAQDITDTYAVPLCDPAAAPPTLTSQRLPLPRRSALPMEMLQQDNAWTPDRRRPTAGRLVPADRLADQVRPGDAGAAWSAAQPTAFTTLRSTYRHEADSAIGFQMFNDPAAMGDAAALHRPRPSNIGYAFNWFYVNSTEAAYFNSGNNPVRSAGVRPEPADAGRRRRTSGRAGTRPPTPPPTRPAAPIRSRSTRTTTSAGTTSRPRTSARPTATSASAPVHRADLLDARVRAAIGRRREARPGRRREGRGRAPPTTDLRGKKVLRRPAPGDQQRSR